MVLKHRVALNGVQLDSLDNRIIITAIDEAAGKDQITAVSRGAGNGQRITNIHRDTLDITIKFALNIRNSDMAGRSTLLDKVNAWARPGGALTVGHRSGKQLTVVLAQAPGGGDQFNWANDFTLVFRAYGVPYWEDVTAVTETSDAGITGSGTITVPGSAETVAEFSITNESPYTLTEVSLLVAGQEMSFTGLSMATDDELVIDHYVTGGLCVLRARVGTTSVLECMSGVDDIVLEPGSRTWSYESDKAATVTVSVKGRYL